MATREEAERIVRQFARVCKGPPLFSDEEQAEIRRLLVALDEKGPQPMLMALARTRIQELLQYIQTEYREELARAQKAVLLPKPENNTLGDVYENLLYLMRLHRADIGLPCGQDVNELILADGVFDGSERTVTCPRCGNVISYSLKLTD
jgi:hypothetical protein